ncbi:pilus (Caulobacter type) biogenesis lipoprotein CpaD [Pannonibacter indicus]|uniref:Pilus (Caulobacter type) biogenesis lipoprotein CpaD n=2 Tax=Pannonibacter indicus TaxID=466044 RepID=A0A0K6HT28_9HYPH|nr:pilus (Caulobacter type) biogenesis lipoprotein CpaD [Pannonibacter indicus]
MNREQAKRTLMGKAAFLTCAAAVLAGCQTQPTPAVMASNDYRVRHPIMITEQAEVLDIPLAASTRNLGRDYSARIAQYGAEARASGASTVEVLVPSGSANEIAASTVVPQIRAALVQGGVAQRNVQVRSYGVADARISTPVRLSYARVKASTGPCGTWPDNIASTIGPNSDYYDFGCATQSNLAAMAANPADLMGPRAIGASDQNRRGVVLEKYRKGEQTAAEYKEGTGANVSGVGNN